MKNKLTKGRVNKSDETEEGRSSNSLNSLLPISKQEIRYVLPDVSPTTVGAVLVEPDKERSRWEDWYGQEYEIY